jgi:hypothetical protein
MTPPRRSAPAASSNPAPLLAAAAALIGVAAARSTVGKVALVAAVGTAAFRLLRRAPGPPQTQAAPAADWCQIRVGETVSPRRQETLPAATSQPLEPSVAEMVADEPEWPSPEPLAAAEVFEPQNLTAPVEEETPEPPTALEEIQPEPIAIAQEELRVEELTVAETAPSLLPETSLTAEHESPFVLPERLPSLPTVPSAAFAHPLGGTTAENPWLLSVEPLPVLAVEEPARLNDALLASGLLGPSAVEDTPPAVEAVAADYLPPLAVGGEIPDAITIEPEAPLFELAKPRASPLPMTSERMAEMLRALATPPVAEPPPATESAAEPSGVNEAAEAVAEVTSETEPEVVPTPVELPRPRVVLPEPRVAPVKVAAAVEPPEAPVADPLVSAAELFANLANNNLANNNLPASTSEVTPQTTDSPAGTTEEERPPVTTSLRPKLRPRPIVTVAHPNHPGRKNWLTWWK